jgi:hypothetical protein
MTEEPQNENIPSEDKIISLLSGFQPKPRQSFYLRMRTAPWNQREPTRSVYTGRMKKGLRLASFALLVCLLIIVPLFFTPSLLSNARQMFRFFGVSDKNRRSIEIIHTPTSTSNSLLSEPSFSLSLDEAAKTAGFQINTLSSLPTGVVLEGAAFDPTRHAVLIRYAGEGRTVLFTQRENNHINEYASVGPEASGEFVMVRGVQGEYIPGGWVVQSQVTPQPGIETATIELVWENQAGMATLRWEENGYVYEIILTGPQNIAKEEILAIAESMH